MPTITPMLDPRYTTDTRPLVVRVQHKHQRRYIPTGIKLTTSQFDNGKIVKHPDARIYNSRLSALLADINRYIADCELHNKRIRLELIGTGSDSHSFTAYLEHRAGQYKQKGQIVMSRKLTRFVTELHDCFGGNVHFDDITADTLRTLDVYLIRAGNNDNTRNKKFKFLRQFFGQAFDEGLTSMRNPFKQYKIPVKPVRKDKLSLAEIDRIVKLSLAGTTHHVRNLFLFSYYAKGARFENCVTLRHAQIKNGRIDIIANKSGKHISVKIHPKLQAILAQYKGKGLVFPFLYEIPTDPTEYLSAIDSQNTIVNRHLKVVAHLAGISINLTFHIARHSFAQHLKDVSGNIHAIQDALGHSDQRITQVYLKALGDDLLDTEMDKLYGS
jgi:site-specific recombinase XerD